MNVHPENCTDGSVKNNTGSVQQVKIAPEMPGRGRDLFWGAILALSIVVNIWSLWIIRDIGTRKWLHDYDLNQFQMGPFAKLQNDVEVTKLLVAARCDKPKEK